MRRRDATQIWPPSQQRRRWRTASFVGLSASVHALLLAVLALAVLPNGSRLDLIRVTLRTGGGTGPAGDSAGGSQFDAAASDAGGGATHTAAAPPAAGARAEPARRRHSPHHGVNAVPAPLAVMDVPLGGSSVPAEGPDAGGTGPGSASSAAQGSGAGASSGSGLGVGEGGDQRASCIYCPEPRYPLIARVRGWQGTVDVGLLVLADGTVDAAKLRRSSGYGALDDAAIAVARRSRFQPPVVNGLPAPLKGRIEYRFELTAAH